MIDINEIKKYYIDENVKIKDNMVLSKTAHTRPVADLKDVSNGVATAQYYFQTRYFDNIEDELAKGIVKELKKLQITDLSSNHYGCLRWYREETFITDTNGAFFVLLPLAAAYILCGSKMTNEEKKDIEEMLRISFQWFKSEITGSIHYSNKIMSDGAMCALISSIIGDGFEESVEFWKKWLDYADKRGMGWGENTSDVYIDIMMTALNIVLLNFKDGELRKRLEEKRNILTEFLEFHGGKPIVPSIRTYNFNAEASYGGSFYKLYSLNEEYLKTKFGPGNVERIPLMRVILAIESGLEFKTEKTTECFRKERVFDDSYACTWKGNGVRLGTITRFPAMKNCYQGEGWGLGWQTMPACVLIENVSICFLRLRTQISNNEHYHPAIDKHSAFLNTSLFEDGNLMTVTTTSSQNNNIALVARSMNKLANTASGIYDEWCIPKGYIGINEVNIKDKIWYIVEYNNCVIALTHLGGFAHGYKSRADINVTTGKSGDFDVISAELYKGEDKLLFQERLESVWAISVFEEKCDFEATLERIEIKDEEVLNMYESESAYNKSRKINFILDSLTTEVVITPDSEIR